jgi:hypothetical protein
VKADQDGSINFIFHQNPDGSNIVRQITVPYTASDFKIFSAPCFSDYVEYTFLNNSGSNQTSFLFETKVLSAALSPQILDLTSFISPAMTSYLTRSVLVGQNTSGTYQNVQTDQFGDLAVSIRSPLSAFGELRTTNFTPIAQYTFPYIINNRLWDTSASTGSATQTIDRSMAKVSTGTTTGSVSEMRSFKRAKYRAGSGIVVRFTALFTDGVAETTQIIGFGDNEDGLFVGYNGTSFGILRRSYTSGVVVDNWTTQSNFSLDPLDGTATLPAIDTSDGNIFEITLQYLGFGMITFSMEDPSTGGFIKFHQIAYANTNEVPSMAVATLPALIHCDNGATTSDITIRSGSMGLFSEGFVKQTAVAEAFSGSLSATTTEQAIFTLKAKTTFGAHENHVNTFIKYVNGSLSSSGNRNCTIKVVLNATLASTSFADVDTNSSQLEIDTAGTITPGSGTTIFVFTLASNSNAIVNVSDLDLFFANGDTLTITGVMGTSTGDLSVALNILEDV